MRWAKRLPALRRRLLVLHKTTTPTPPLVLLIYLFAFESQKLSAIGYVSVGVRILNQRGREMDPNVAVTCRDTDIH